MVTKYDIDRCNDKSSTTPSLNFRFSGQLFLTWRQPMIV